MNFSRVIEADGTRSQLRVRRRASDDDTLQSICEYQPSSSHVLITYFRASLGSVLDHTRVATRSLVVLDRPSGFPGTDVSDCDEIDRRPS